MLITTNPQLYVEQHFQLDLARQHPDTYCIKPEKSIGIEDVRHIISYAQHRPLVKPHKHIVILDAHTATIEAQNALLKLLEEPPSFVTIILVTPQATGFLETVTSRCQIIFDHHEDAANTVTPTTDDYQALLALPLVARLQLIPATKSKQDMTIWINTLISSARKHYRENPHAHTLHNLTVLLQTKEYLDKNANPTTIASDTVLQLMV